MQFLVILAALSFLASSTQAVPVAEVAERNVLSGVNLYSKTSCKSQIGGTMDTDYAGKGANNGECFTFLVGKTVKSVDVQSLMGSCTGKYFTLSFNDVYFHYIFLRLTSHFKRPLP
jgi:hypothetical protein